MTRQAPHLAAGELSTSPGSIVASAPPSLSAGRATPAGRHMTPATMTPKANGSILVWFDELDGRGRFYRRSSFEMWSLEP
jgi:hypothetical protein